MKTTDKKNLQKILMRRYGRRFFLAIAVFTPALAGVFLIVYIIGTSRVWRMDRSIFEALFYLALSFAKANPFLTFALAWALGIIVIAVFQWRHIAKDIIALSDSIAEMTIHPEDPIALPKDLREVQTALQKVQYDSMRTQRQAQEAEQRKNDLVVYLAHDLKTPLTSVLGYLTLLRDEKEISPELREKYLAIAAKKAVRLEDLINEFFEITRFSLKGLVLEPTRLNFSRMLEQINSEFLPLYSPKNLRAVLNVPPDVEITADAGKLERVVDNLMRNAVNYSYPDSEIAITLSALPDWVQLTVLNHGDTIPEHKLRHIFEQFYRVDSARSGEEGGAGLGLAIAKEIVDLHGGGITARSEDSLIEFTVFLPYGAPPQPAPVAYQPQQQAQP